MSPRTRTVLLALGSAIALGASAHAAPLPRMLELYATTDLHGHLTTHSIRTSTDSRGSKKLVEVGGLALIGGYLKNARAHFPGKVLLLDGGDLFQGTLASNLSEGAAMIRGLNVLGYAATALGNHEFDYGPVGPNPVPTAPGDDPRGALTARMKEARFPILASNLAGDRGERPFGAYVIRELDGVKVAIIGATTLGLPSTTMRPNVVGLHVDPLLPSVLAAAERARKEGARVFVLVMHAGGECQREARAWKAGDSDDLAGCQVQEEGFALVRDLAAAAKTGGPKFSAVIGGHTHQSITAVIDGIPFLQAGKNGEHLMHASIEVRGHGGDASATGRFVIEHGLDLCARVDARGACASADDKTAHPPDYFGPVTPDATVTAAIAADLENARVVAARPIGIELPDGMIAGYSDESPLGNFAADALRAAAKADIGIINGGGLRADLPAGPLTYGALYEAFPFDNQLVSVEMSGADLRRTVVHNLHSRYGALSYSGLSVSARCEGGKVLIDIKLPSGRLLDAKARYYVGAPDFLAQGGDDAVRAPRTTSPPIELVRVAMEKAFHAHGGVLRGSDPAVFDPTHTRVVMPTARPIRCGEIEAHEESAIEKGRP